MGYAHTIGLDLPYQEAVGRVKDTFKAKGFGTLTEIDVQATLKEKLGVEAEHYIILGVCNPRLAHRALEVDRTVGLLLPYWIVTSPSFRTSGEGKRKGGGEARAE